MVSIDEVPTLAILREHLRPLANHVLFVCNAEGHRLLIEPRRANDSLSPKVTKAYEAFAGLKFYTMSWHWKAKEGEVGLFPGEITVESNLVALGAVTYNRCRDVAYWCRPVLEKLLLDNPNVASARQVQGSMRPNAIYVHEDHLGKEEVFSHDFLVITLKNNKKFVFDPAGYRLGYKDYVHEMEDYKKVLQSWDFVKIEEEELSLKKDWSWKKWRKMVNDWAEVERRSKTELQAASFW